MTKYTANYIGIAKTFYSGGGSWDLYDQGEFLKSGKWTGLLPPGVSGGNILNGQEKIVNSVAYKYHTFTSPGALTVGTATSVDILLVGGGAAGGFVNGGGPFPGGGYGGGGAAGGVVYVSGVNLPVGEYQVSVGVGGSSITTNGTDSSIYSVALFQNILVAKGGGTGAYGPPGVAASPGGSGGGGNPAFITPGAGVQPTIPQYFPTTHNKGNPGAPFSPGNRSAGGGGATNSTNSPTYPSVGGAGIQITPNFLDFYGDTVGIPALNPLNGVFGGGGGGTLYSGAYPDVTVTGGGPGGGGLGAGYAQGSTPHPQGTPYNNYAFGWASTPGVSNSGGGGGAGMGPPWIPSGIHFGSPGGSGIVILRYRV